MAYVLNATEEHVTIQARGNYFSFKPKQMKQMDDNLALFVTTDQRAKNGLVTVSESFEDPSYKDSPEGKVEYAEAVKRGIDAFIRGQRELIQNNQVSLRRDLAKANLQYDPAIEASEGELQAMRLVAKYQKSMDDADQKKADEIKELMRKIGK